MLITPTGCQVTEPFPPSRFFSPPFFFPPFFFLGDKPLQAETNRLSTHLGFPIWGPFITFPQLLKPINVIFLWWVLQAVALTRAVQRDFVIAREWRPLSNQTQAQARPRSCLKERDETQKATLTWKCFFSPSFLSPFLYKTFSLFMQRD